ncbi:MAG: 50S ribosomal protein L9 [Alphaproteobacteria bacterium]|nr:50S ribosomal protein L9 [Rickettsiales bacterium]
MLRSFRSIGKSGQIIDVKAGYAKNYLVPFGIAAYATREELKRIEIKKDLLIDSDKKRVDSVLKLKEKIEKKYLIIVRAAGDDGRLYGSVRTTDIATLVQKEIDNADIDLKVHASDIDMGQGIKKVGIYSRDIYLHSDVVTVKLSIARSETDALANQKIVETTGSLDANTKSVSKIVANLRTDIQDKKKSDPNDKDGVMSIAGDNKNKEEDKLNTSEEGVEVKKTDDSSNLPAGNTKVGNNIKNITDINSKISDKVK